MVTFLDYLNEARLARKVEEDFFKYKRLSEQISKMNAEIYSAVESSADKIILRFCELCKLDHDKFLKENPNVLNKILKLILPSKGTSFMPIAVLYYGTSDTYMLVMSAVSGSKIKALLGMTAGVFGYIYRKLSGNDMQLLMVPIKLDADTGRISIDSSFAGMGQLAMTLLLSDIDCEIIWPVSFGGGEFSRCIMKTLDFICPSLIDLLSVCTFGGASVASRVAKLSKYGAKIGNKALKVAAKSGSTAAKKSLAKNMSKNGLKFTVKNKKMLSAIPAPVRKFLTKNKNKLKQANATSRILKDDIKKLLLAKQEYEQIKSEVLSMSTDDMFVFSQHAVKLLVKTYLPRDKKHMLDKIVGQIPDSVIDSVSEYAKSRVKEWRGEEVAGKTTINDVIINAIPEKLKDKFKKFAGLG